MSDDFTIDTSELYAAVVDLSKIPADARLNVRAAVQYNLQEVKASWRDKLEGIQEAPRVPFSISYDTEVSGNEVRGEVGANKGTGQQGGVALLLEYGTRKTMTGARGFGLASLLENLDDLESGVGKAIGDAAEKHGW